MSEWIKKRKEEIEAKKNMQSQIEELLPETFDLIVSEIRKQAQTVNQEIYQGENVINVGTTGEKFTVIVDNSRIEKNSNLHFDSQKMVLIVSDSLKNETQFSVNIDDAAKLQLSKVGFGEQGADVPSEIAELLIDSLLKEDYGIK